MFLYTLADSAFGPLRDLLLQVLSWLGNVQLVAARGLNIGYYLGPFAWAGQPWLDFIRHLLLAVSLYTVLYVVKGGYNLYLDIKAGIKWW